MSCGDIPDGLPTEEQGEALMPKKQKVQRVDKSLCQKCKASKSMYIIRGVTYCKACFEVSVSTRFIRTMYPPLKASYHESQNNTSKKVTLNQGGTRPFPTGGSTIIGLSGGSGSITLLDLLSLNDFIGKSDDKMIYDKTKGEKEPIWKRGYIVHVDFSDILNNNNDKESQDRTDFLHSWVKEKENGYIFIGLKAHDVFNPNLKLKIQSLAGLGEDEKDESSQDGIAVDLKNPDLPLFPTPESSSSTSTPLEQLRSLLASLPPPSRPSLLSSILNHLLTFTSIIIPNISHILLGETSTRQAQRLISGTALGKGYTLPLDLSITHKQSNGITKLKPMKDITTKEVAIYTHLKGLNKDLVRNERRWDNSGPIGKKDSRGKGDTKSLESLTEQFIASLGVTHPATVSTINRTGDKLTFTGKKGQGVSCPVCEMPVDPNALEWKSRTALTSLSTKIIPEDLVSKDVKDEENKDKLATLLCYACLTTFTPPTVVSKVARDEVSPIQLPYYVSNNAQYRKTVGREEMKDQIKDFLIDQ
ncbi:uncharacterized protein L201_003008 [Kwoniella dendrophila CBS 6074]|uniref:Cytoplasmic tRNA 2-thiolation protein 2 n=1 Tax=Kwoniella dendrophila CBS 6074 TaxID=1295534 RepID=A0AAX4JTH1_9TREE